MDLTHLVPDSTFLTLLNFGPPEDPVTLSSTLMDSGLTGFLAFGMTLAAIFFSIRSALENRMGKLAPETLQRSLERSLQDGEVEQAGREAEVSQTHLGRVISAGLIAGPTGLDDMLMSANRASTVDTIKLGSRLSRVSKLGGLVLLVTGIGMTQSLATVAYVVARDPEVAMPEIASGLFVSFGSTSLGLLAATICYGTFFWLDSQLTKRLLRVREIAEDMIHYAAKKRTDSPPSSEG